jgi:RNA polymerase sigma-70 factor
MTSPLNVSLNILAGQAYLAGVGCHGDLGLEPERYAGRLLSVAKKRLGASISLGSALALINGLHTSDLYLTVACAKPTDAAWERFDHLYQAFISRVARAVCFTPDAARAVSDSILGRLFLPDASGRSRIASYEGRCSLAAWVSAVINNNAINAHRRCKDLESLESLPDIADHAVLGKIEAVARAHRYESFVRDSFIGASESLSEHERFVLSLRYEDGLRCVEIAGILGVHPSTITRQLPQICEKLKGKTVSILASKHRLNSTAIEECLDDIRENSSYSMLASLKVAG